MSNIRIITPSYLIKKKSDHSRGTKQLAMLGFKVLNPEYPKLLPSPREKADQLHQAFSDPEADIILAQRGGYGAMKSLPFIDFDLIKKHPKILAGFSDLSVLLTPIFDRTGIVTLHSPMVVNLATPAPFTIRSFMNAMSGYPERNLLRGAPVTVYHPGSATGVLKGGNLVTLTALMGTDWDIDLAGSIVFLEEVDEKLHKIDRCLTQWILAGRFKGVRGLVLGDFHGIRSRQVFDILASQMELNFPVIHCPCIGHVERQITMPIGAEVELNSEKKQLVIKKISLPGMKR